MVAEVIAAKICFEIYEEQCYIEGDQLSSTYEVKINFAVDL